MDTQAEKLKTAHWILEKNLAWIAASEVKTAFVFTITTAMLGTLASLYGQVPVNLRVDYLFKLMVLTSSLQCGVIFCTAMVVFPRVKGPDKSLIFFGRINDLGVDEYKKQFDHYGYVEALDDCLMQIHRNAQIACDKFYWVRKAMWGIFISVIPWTITLALLMKAKGIE